ncbi:MAG: 16S rRNA (guanine(527)-N(7))-methyltransferase RsmG [Polyangiaceae bacterium]|nr:16S rRNA (guanine(527)-N(7))-methyltransferase RsmG [Polyangiaceae bacterium]
MTGQHCNRLGIQPAHQDGVRRWLELLSHWNARIDLTAARSHDELYDLMLADAALLAKYIPLSARVVDVGSGAGAPGLALALVRPDLKLTLVEPLRKRVAFLRTVIGTLERFDIELVSDRGELVAAKRRRNWDVAISRATLAPEAWVPLGLELAPVAWALLAQGEPPAVEGARIAEDIAYRWPLTGATRRAVRFVSP